jgi:hypothetical protein
MPKDEHWDELAGLLNVNIRNINRWKHFSDSPREPDVEAWRQWMVDNGKGETRRDRAIGFKMPSGLVLPGKCSYDEAMASGDYPAVEALRREQIREQELKNEKLHLEVARAKGSMFSDEDIEDRDDKINQVIVAEAEKAQRLLDGIDGVTPDIRKAFMDRFKKWRHEMADALGKAHK